MNAANTDQSIDEIIRDKIGAVMDFRGEANLDEIAEQLSEELGDIAIKNLLTDTGKDSIEELILMYLDDRA